MALKLPRIQSVGAQLRVVLTVQIVDLEEEDELLVGALAGELMHRLDELGHADGAVLVAVEDAEGSLHKERLQKDTGKIKLVRCNNFSMRCLVKDMTIEEDNLTPASRSRIANWRVFESRQG